MLSVQRCFFTVVVASLALLPFSLVVVTLRAAIATRQRTQFLENDDRFLMSSISSFSLSNNLLLSNQNRQSKIDYVDEYLRKFQLEFDNATNSIVATRSNKSSTIAPRPVNETDFERIFQKRKGIVSEQCMKYLKITPSKHRSIAVFKYQNPFRFIYLNEKHKILFCSVPKVASTTWRQFFLTLAGQNVDKISDHDALHKDANLWPHLKPLSTYANMSEEGFMWLVRDYAKVMWVRDPMQRVISAWNNKLVQNNEYYHRVFANHIIKVFRSNKTDNSHVTLIEFLRFLNHPFHSKSDVHWEPMYRLCLPCLLQYDYIGHLENGNDEANYVIKKVTNQEKILFPSPMNSPLQQQFFIQMLKTVPRHLLQATLSKYEIDIKMFDYL